jgi:class 3 adenylate cyclase/tetratricopeptide (TPR) repeat protein
MPVAERRVTSVLFADLVGFTPLSEARDSEDVRDLLSRYFAVARTVIARFGGTVEKFIGDAVMAVWGVPTAQEDDAERAVRAGLDLVDAITALGEEIGTPELAMRVGIVTGEVAVTLGATGEGMVAGDAVNTAARVQSVADPNEVWVDETTRRLTAAGIAYTDAGTHQLKGKSEPMPLFAARQVVGSVGGTQRVDGLEAPFVGRDREMRLVKELFHATTEEGRPRLVAVSGLPGVGKTRLGWEFFKYIDGLASQVRWHRGRCLSYGEGIAFRALADMVRSRLDVLEGDEPATVATKLDAGLQQWVPDPEERSWLAPRLAVLIGGDVATTASYVQEDLFAAWQVFFERLIDQETIGVALLVEDLQWADDGLLDFIDHVLARSQAPIFVLTLSRPELDERRPGWSGGRRSTPLHLEPLAVEPMARLVDGLVDGLSPALRDALVTRSEGIPLYAVETVRSLIDRDVVIPQGGRYVLAPNAEPNLDEAAPTSLHTLIAARLDTLTPDERRAVQDASVLGLSFPRAALAALNTAGGAIADLDAALGNLVRKEILTLDSDPRSPERGQYRFVQAMVRTVAYETLSRRDRKTRHLVAAEHLSGDADADVYAAVIASHYLDATAAEPDAPDTEELASRGIAMLETAAARSLALGTPTQAKRHYQRALEFARDDVTRARLSVGAAASAITAGDTRGAEQLAQQAIEAADAAGMPLLVGQALSLLATVLNNQGIGHDLPDRLIPVFNDLPDTPETMEVRTRLAQQISRAYFASLSDLDEATRWADTCTTLAEAAENWQLVSETLGGYGAVLMSTGRPTMGLGLIRVALDVAREHDLMKAELIPLNNLASFQAARDLTLARQYVDEGLALARRLGDLDTGAYLLSTAASVYCLCGAWDEIFQLATDAEMDGTKGMTSVLTAYATVVQLARGEAVSAPVGEEEHELGPQLLAAQLMARAAAAWSTGNRAQAVEWMDQAVDAYHQFGGLDDDFPTYWSTFLDFAVADGRLDRANHWLRLAAETPRGRQPLLVRALIPYFRARLNRDGDANLVDGDFAEATEALRAYGAPYWLARSLLEHAEFLVEANRVEASTRQLDEAEQLFAGLAATPWVERCRRARALAVR